MLHCDQKLFLVFEYLDYDLKKFMDKSAPNGIPPEHVKVGIESIRACVINIYLYIDCMFNLTIK